MLGSEGVGRHLTLKLERAMPPKLHEMRQRLTAELPDPVTPATLPEVQRWIPFDIDQLEVGGFPCVLITEVESTGRLANIQQEVGLSYNEWTFEYIMRIFVWAMGDTAGGVALMRNRYVQAIEEILLGNKLVYQSDTEQLAVDGSTIRHSYADAAEDDHAQILQGGYVEVRIKSIERVNTVIPPYQPEGLPIITSVTLDTEP